MEQKSIQKYLVGNFKPGSGTSAVCLIYVRQKIYRLGRRDKQFYGEHIILG